METLPPPIKLEPLTRRQKPARRQWWRRSKGPRALRDIRERAGISLETIAERTRIPLHHLEEIERGDVSNLPPGIYAKSWARDYAREIGVEPEAVLAAVAPVAAVEPSIDEIRQVREQRERMVVESPAPGPPMAALMRKVATVLIVLTLVALAVLYWWNATAPEQSAPAPAPVGTGGAVQPPASQ